MERFVQSAQHFVCLFCKKSKKKKKPNHIRLKGLETNSCCCIVSSDQKKSPKVGKMLVQLFPPSVFKEMLSPWEICTNQLAKEAICSKWTHSLWSYVVFLLFLSCSCDILLLMEDIFIYIIYTYTYIYKNFWIFLYSDCCVSLKKACKCDVYVTTANHILPASLHCDALDECTSLFFSFESAYGQIAAVLLIVLLHW